MSGAHLTGIGGPVSLAPVNKDTVIQIGFLVGYHACQWSTVGSMTSYIWLAYSMWYSMNVTLISWIELIQSAPQYLSTLNSCYLQYTAITRFLETFTDYTPLLHWFVYVFPYSNNMVVCVYTLKLIDYGNWSVLIIWPLLYRNSLASQLTISLHMVALQFEWHCGSMRWFTSKKLNESGEFLWSSRQRGCGEFDNEQISDWSTCFWLKQSTSKQKWSLLLYFLPST